MQQITAPIERADSHIGAIVIVEFGKAYGLPKLIGTGQIVDEQFRHGITHLLVQPIEGMRFEKWVTEAQILGYDWTQPVIVELPINEEIAV